MSMSRVLLAVRLKPYRPAEEVAELAGVDTETLEAALAEAEAAGFVIYRDGRLTGWALKPDGRTESNRLVAAELEAAGCRDEVEKAYRRFVDLNLPFKQVTTDWQVRDGTTPNDHSDAAYDAAVVGRLAEIHAGVSPIVDELVSLLPRFAGYGPRLANALARVQAGEMDYFAKPLIDSYHTVWFELHEDLLVTLGLERSEEDA